MDLDAERGEDGRVLDPDDPRADDSQLFRNAVDAEDRVAVADHIAVECHVIRSMRGGAGGDEDDTAIDDLFTNSVPDGDAGRRNEACRPFITIDLVPPQVVLDPLPFVRDYTIFAVHEVGDGDAVDGQIDGALAEAALPEAGEVKGGLAQCFRGDRAGVDAGPAENGLALDESHALAEVGRLRGALLAGRPGTDDDEVV